MARAPDGPQCPRPSDGRVSGDRRDRRRHDGVSPSGLHRRQRRRIRLEPAGEFLILISVLDTLHSGKVQSPLKIVFKSEVDH